MTAPRNDGGADSAPRILCKGCGSETGHYEGWCLSCGFSFRGQTEFHKATEHMRPVDRIRATLLLNGINIPDRTADTDGSHD